MRFAFLGAGAVGGYYAALLSRSGCEVSVVARGAHLEAIRKDGLRILSGAVGDFTARIGAESDPDRIGVVDTVVVAVKTYDNATALPLLLPRPPVERPLRRRRRRRNPRRRARTRTWDSACSTKRVVSVRFFTVACYDLLNKFKRR